MLALPQRERRTSFLQDGKAEEGLWLGLFPPLALMGKSGVPWAELGERVPRAPLASPSW